VVLLAVAAVVRRDALRPPGGHLGALIVVHGLVGVAALQWTYFVAIDRLPVAMALLLEPIGSARWAGRGSRSPWTRSPSSAGSPWLSG
jgi:threonine/homoserine efflux transporter RhtA